MGTLPSVEFLAPLLDQPAGCDDDLTSSTESASQLRTELNNCFSFGTAKSLNICICCDEFNTSNTFINHSVDGIAATSTDTNNFNYCALCSSSVK